MVAIDCMKALAKDFFSKKTWWCIFPFSLLAILGMGLYFFLVPLYMIFDLGVRIIDDILCGHYDNTSGATLAVRNLIGFIFILPFYGLTVFGLLFLAFIYFLVFIFAFIGGVFRKSGKMFAFHDYFKF